jgi:hypothetical protein
MAERVVDSAALQNNTNATDGGASVSLSLFSTEELLNLAMLLSGFPGGGPTAKKLYAARNKHQLIATDLTIGLGSPSC